ncbi:Sir2 family NAD-dependent protein deacetylase [Demequina sp.]|uniref:SIR2 family NAD-dependent protein deacylase n=1 Tax=Demequina sp. TaxID=2050685 RepID=UPI0025C6DBEE|nr:Sir2 family NAD-dependent protein deacetylase [Demequina sp.]
MPASRITVLTGAGISTGSGIPDFRGPVGVWTLHPERMRLLDIDAFMSDREVRVAGWREWRDHPAWTSEPSVAHRALARLADAGGLGVVLTQNFDGLHQTGGLSGSQVVEMHGTLHTTSCTRCGEHVDTAAVVASLIANPDPACATCGGILKPDIVYFGEALPADAIDRAVEGAEKCDVFIAIGTTLSVYPVASLAGLAVDSGADLIIVNAEPTEYDRLASEVIREPIDIAVPALVDRYLGEGRSTSHYGN